MAGDRDITGPEAADLFTQQIRRYERESELRQRVLEQLRQDGRSSASRLATELNVPLFDLVHILERMATEGLVRTDSTPQADVVATA